QNLFDFFDLKGRYIEKLDVPSWEEQIEFLQTNQKFGGRVVVLYDIFDVKCLFLVSNCLSRIQTFEQSKLIISITNQLYPTPITLKFKKIYELSVLKSQKRYVSISYETLDQLQPKFDVKDIETIRRDTCSAVSKMLERLLKLLFRTKDVTKVKQYV
ncbi:unnamed protein product, partial [Didymodactylos carnosus]